jgi:hypothetical protein
VSFRGAFRVEDFDGDRGHLALERLHAGHLVVLQGLGLRVKGGALLVTMASAWTAIPQSDDVRVKTELDEAEAHWRALTAAMPAAQALCDSRNVTLELVLDYDTGSVLLARRALDR